MVYFEALRLIPNFKSAIHISFSASTPSLGQLPHLHRGPICPDLNTSQHWTTSLEESGRENIKRSEEHQRRTKTRSKVDIKKSLTGLSKPICAFVIPAVEAEFPFKPPKSARLSSLPLQCAPKVLCVAISTLRVHHLVVF